MPIPLIDIEHRINFLRKINVSTLDLESRIEYHSALAEALTTRLKYLLNCFNYKTAFIVEAELKAEKQALENCYALLSPAEAKRLEIVLPAANRFTDMAIKGEYANVMSFGDVERNIRTILFGLPVEVIFDGTGFILTKTFPGLDIEPELTNLEAFCEKNEFKLLDNEKRTKRKEGESEKSLYLQVVKSKD